MATPSARRHRRASRSSSCSPVPHAVPGNAVAVTQTQVQALLPRGDRRLASGGPRCGRRATARERAGPGRQPGHEHPGPGSRRRDHDQPDRRGQQLVRERGTGSSRAFGLAGPGGETVAGPGSPAAGEVDLLTVLEHELGHVIGLADNTQAGDLMDVTLGLGVRRALTARDVATVDAALASLTIATAGNGKAPDPVAIESTQRSPPAEFPSSGSPRPRSRNTKAAGRRSQSSLPQGLLFLLFPPKSRRLGQRTHRSQRAPRRSGAGKGFPLKPVSTKIPR